MLKQRLDYIYVIEKMSNWHKKEVTKGLLRFFFPKLVGGPRGCFRWRPWPANVARKSIFPELRATLNRRIEKNRGIKKTQDSDMN